MVALDRTLISPYRLSTVTMLLCAAIWPQFAMPYFGEMPKVFVMSEVM